MTTKNLYRYKESDGSVTITPTQREPQDPVYAWRLIADEGKILTNGEIETYCIDTQNIDEWTEIDEQNLMFISK